MFILLLSYVRPLAEVDRWLEDHKAWVRQGFDDGVFLAAGRQEPRTGGVILAAGESRAALEARAAGDPFVRQGVAETRIIEMQPSTLDPRLDFLARL